MPVRAVYIEPSRTEFMHTSIHKLLRSATATTATVPHKPLI